jgi:hypothetical protein
MPPGKHTSCLCVRTVADLLSNNIDATPKAHHIHNTQVGCQKVIMKITMIMIMVIMMNMKMRMTLKMIMEIKIKMNMILNTKIKMKMKELY